MLEMRFKKIKSCEPTRTPVNWYRAVVQILLSEAEDLIGESKEAGTGSSL